MFTPSTTNFLQPNGFIVVLERSPEVSFFAQAITIPDMSIDNPRRSNPFVAIPEPGDHIQFSPLTIEFQVDADVANWETIHSWMTQIGFPEEYQQFTDGINDIKGDSVGTIQNLKSDITITVLDNNKKPKIKFTFRDCIPSTLSGLSLDLNGDVEPIIASASFDYAYYTMSRAV